ncbi:MAG TPA: SDR family oxidoreductase [Vicinamibacterales bacterium]|nr:SDR family oxidoreductase [Vicinamibacterales bacterium]
MSDPFGLSGKRIVVTGGTRGIGAAISRRFALAGARVVAGYARNDAAARALADEVAREGASLELCRADLASEEGRRRLTEAAGAPLAGLVHCAATGVHRKIEELTLRHWDFTFGLNLRAFFDLVRLLLPAFAPGSSIVALSSEGAVHAFPQYTLVGATKGGLEALCRHLAVELAPRGIRVNVLSPGSVLTEAWEAFPDRDARLQEAIARCPRGRLATPEEVACAAQFLCSDASAGVNGATLVVDGGQRIRG